MPDKDQLRNSLLERVNQLYEWLDAQIKGNRDLAGLCTACGRCCDFEAFGHHLFVSSPELLYFAVKLGPENARHIKKGRCPYNIAGRCTVYEHRFAACRIFCCKGDPDFQSALSESALKLLRAMCDEFEIPYRYTDLPTALNGPARQRRCRANTCQPAAKSGPLGLAD
jgi:Fe-S-cluster containining protein